MPSLSSKKLTDSGFVFEHGVEDIFYDAIKCGKEKGLLLGENIQWVTFTVGNDSVLPDLPF